MCFQITRYSLHVKHFSLKSSVKVNERNPWYVMLSTGAICCLSVHYVEEHPEQSACPCTITDEEKGWMDKMM